MRVANVSLSLVSHWSLASQPACSSGVAQRSEHCVLELSRGFSSALYWLVSPAVLGALCICFGFLLIVAAGQRARYRREAGRLKEEWLRYRREMQTKVRFSVFAIWHTS